ERHRRGALAGPSSTFAGPRPGPGGKTRDSHGRDRGADAPAWGRPCLLWKEPRGVVSFSSLGAGRFKEEPMGTPTRRTVLRGTAAIAGLTAVSASGLASAAQAAPAGTNSGHPKANVLLVHGAWVDGSSWNRVIAILQQRGHRVVAVQLPLTSLAEDVAWTRHVLAERLHGPTVMAGHSYGGAVISGAATGVDTETALV